MVVEGLHEGCKVLVGVIQVDSPRFALATFVFESGKNRVFVLLQSNKINVLDGDLGAQPDQDYKQARPQDELKDCANG